MQNHERYSMTAGHAVFLGAVSRAVTRQCGTSGRRCLGSRLVLGATTFRVKPGRQTPMRLDALIGNQLLMAQSIFALADHIRCDRRLHGAREVCRASETT